MKQLMDGLLLHSTIAGNPGDDFTNAEPIYTLTTTPCPYSFNEDCAHGDACLTLASAGSCLCYTGDPHGANIYDVTAWTAWAAAMNGWSGAGDFVDTLDSSACLGGADNVWPFQAGYHMD